ncbi:MAG: alpha/beta fold hydrolase, partial [Leptolyngbya sp. SIO1D8]|nr:alpha/beta fold hydrolase [Leptolyngbya sp. SIO1D8]
WRSNWVALAQHQTVYALDLLGFGASQKAATIFNADLWSHQIYDFWSEFIGVPMVLMGHSLGALVALNSAVNYPQMVERLVMLSLPAAREELLTGWMEWVSRKLEQTFSTPLLIRPLFKFVRQPWVIRGVLRGLYQTPERVDTELVKQIVDPTADRGAARTLCYLVRSRTELQFTPETRKLVSQLTMPTLLLWGQADNVIPLSWGKQIAPINPLVTFLTIPKVGHYLYDEAPEVINQRILTWLQAPIPQESPTLVE